jgi:SAM-dependent methyltransferase
MRSAVAWLLRHVPVPETVLDVGCGDGHAMDVYLTQWKLPPDAIEGVEPQGKYSAALRFKVYAVDIERERLPLADMSKDVVICNQVLEHLKVVIAPMREMARVTRVGGHVLIGVPNLASLISRINLFGGRDPICLAFPGPHIRGFTHRSFLRFLRSNPNLSLKAVTGSSLYPVPPPFMEPMGRLFPGLACYTFYLLQKHRHAPERDWPVDQFPDESITG